MKLYISTTGIKRVLAVSSAAIPAAGGGGGLFLPKMKGKHSVGRRLTNRTAMLPAVLLLGFVLPFIFVRTAFLVLEYGALCSSSIGCLTWRFLGGSDSAQLREELTRALLEVATGSNEDRGEVGIQTSEGSTGGPISFKDLVSDTTNSNKQGIKAFAIKAKTMIQNMEHIVKTAKGHESVYWHLAAHGVPKSLHCLSLKLAEEYAVNAVARSRIPLPQYVYRLTDPSFHHVVLLTDNVLAASVVISSAIKTSINPEKLVFHVVTDKKSYTSMHAWFAVNKIDSAVIEIKGLHQYDWSHEVNVGVKEMLEIHHQIRNHEYKKLKEEDLEYMEENYHKLNVLNPSCISLLNHLRVYLPELFPDLNRVVFLDDDVVVQRDLSFLWDMDLYQKVVGAVADSWCGRDCCPGRKYKDYFDFTHTIISSNLDQDRCGWLYGMNVFDLRRWRKTNITAVYHDWLKLSLDSGFALWHPGALPPALVAFEGHVHHIDPSWHVAGMGHQYPEVDRHKLEAAAVIHFSGPAKPWLEIGSPEVKGLWYRHVNASNEYVTRCGITA
ncbi:probable galacturonosyltransferase 15 isoform X1 [Sesamum indicum]|uniref:Hexosyltransferase n=2 Tax=Sesamum indicum TaxID=4182 RepID=A0A6I9UHI1_SESIN|nr:probable galacturonosyltransferase 15 isoform X1 [Sesamum indicum]XP_011098075.1 probable galacturonosyltransferase 15 isoform X1 [Sesamum indicum]